MKLFIFELKRRIANEARGLSGGESAGESESEGIEGSLRRGSGGLRRGSDGLPPLGGLTGRRGPYGEDDEDGRNRLPFELKVKNPKKKTLIHPNKP